MALFNNLLPISFSNVTRVPTEKPRTAKVNEPAPAPAKTPKTPSDGAKNKADESGKTSQFANVYDDELQERAEEDKAEAAIAEAKATSSVPPAQTQPADAEGAESGSVLPAAGESLPGVSAANGSEAAHVEVPGEAASVAVAGDSDPAPSDAQQSRTILETEFAAQPDNTGTPVQARSGADENSAVAVLSDEAPHLQTGAYVVEAAGDAGTEHIEATAAAAARLPAGSSASEENDAGETEDSVEGADALRLPAGSYEGTAAVALQGDVDSQSADIAWQVDLADRVKAWRGLAGQDSAGGSQQITRHEFAMNGVVTSQNGQLQQFAESLRAAVNSAVSADAAVTDKLAPPTTSAPKVAGSAAANSGSAGDSANAWRADSGMAPTPGATGKASGAMSFAQTLQASTFGQSLGQAVGDSEWGESISQRVALLAGQKISSARIDLDPPELGAMTVKITVNGDQASVSFQTHHAIVRDALEQSLPRLQDLLGQQGLQLADAQVSDNPSARQQQEQSGGGSAGSGGTQEQELPEGSTSHTVRVAAGLVDYYA